MRSASAGVGRPGTIAVRSACRTSWSTWPGSDCARAPASEPSPASSERPALVSVPSTTSPRSRHWPRTARTRSARVASWRRGAHQSMADVTSSSSQAPSAEASTRRTSRRRSGSVGAVSSGDRGRWSAVATARGIASQARSRAACCSAGGCDSQPSNPVVGRMLTWSRESAATSPAAEATSISRAVASSLAPTTRAVRVRSRAGIPPARSRVGGTAAHARPRSPVRCRTSRTAPTAPGSTLEGSGAGRRGVGSARSITVRAGSSGPDWRRIATTSAGRTARSPPRGTST